MHRVRVTLNKLHLLFIIMNGTVFGTDEKPEVRQCSGLANVDEKQRNLPLLLEKIFQARQNRLSKSIFHGCHILSNYTTPQHPAGRFELPGKTIQSSPWSCDFWSSSRALAYLLWAQKNSRINRLKSVTIRRDF